MGGVLQDRQLEVRVAGGGRAQGDRRAGGEDTRERHLRGVGGVQAGHHALQIAAVGRGEGGRGGGGGDVDLDAALGEQCTGVVEQEDRWLGAAGQGGREGIPARGR